VTASVVARQSGGATVLAQARATSPVRLVRPTFPGSRASAVCLVTFGGGLKDGDDIEVVLEVEPGATLVVFTQASTKVFRGASRQRIQASVRGRLVLMPDPVACFGGADYRQRVEVDLVGAGSCVLFDSFTSGRPAYGDRWAFARIDMRTTVTVDGRRLLARDALVLDADHGSIADRMGRFEALGTVLALGRGAAPVVGGVLDEARVGADIVAAPSAVADGAVVRIAATSSAALVDEVRRRLRNLPDMEAVDPFAARH
jgi:urease accessory protein